MSILVVIIAIIGITAVVFTVTPVPASLLMRKLFEKPNLAEPDGYSDIESRVTVYRDIEYKSDFSDNKLDMYLPANMEDKHPIVLWVHGGAYVGGDKGDILYYSTALSSEGYAVISMNYQRAPEAKYPVPIVQIGEVYSWILSVAEEFSLDVEKLVLAGDSAGAHSVSIFSLIQTNPEYSNEIGIEALVPKEHIKGQLLYCGPFDVEMVGNVRGVFGFMLSKAGWAYFGSKNWAEEYNRIATVRYHVTEEYPSTFITDSNTASFEGHGKDFVGQLESVNVRVESYFIPIEEEKTMHEYQFLMDTPSGRECYKRTVQFLEEIVK